MLACDRYTHTVSALNHALEQHRRIMQHSDLYIVTKYRNIQAKPNNMGLYTKYSTGKTVNVSNAQNP